MYIEFNKENNKESPKFKVGDNVIIRKYKNSLKKFLWLKKLKKLCHKNLLLVILTEKKSLECFTKNSCKKQIKRSLELKKWWKENTINYMLNRKAMIILLIVGLIIKHSTNERISFKTKIISSKCKTWIRFA